MYSMSRFSFSFFFLLSLLQNAEYQREVVWNVEQMRGLIDSLLGNFYVPPVLIAVNSETLKRTCIDGKQRLTAIHKYVSTPVSVSLSCISPCPRRFMTNQLSIPWVNDYEEVMDMVYYDSTGKANSSHHRYFTNNT